MVRIVAFQDVQREVLELRQMVEMLQTTLAEHCDCERDHSRDFEKIALLEKGNLISEGNLKFLSGYDES